jgi:hypothetical protein
VRGSIEVSAAYRDTLVEAYCRPTITSVVPAQILSHSLDTVSPMDCCLRRRRRHIGRMTLLGGEAFGLQPV